MRHSYASAQEKRIDLWIGFGGWIVVSAITLVVAVLLGSSTGPVLAGLLVLATIAAGIWLSLTRAYAAAGLGLGVMAVIGLVVVEIPFSIVSLVIDVATGGPHTAYCANYSGTGLCGPPITIAMWLIGLAVFAVVAFFSLRAIHQRIR